MPRPRTVAFWVPERPLPLGLSFFDVLFFKNVCKLFFNNRKGTEASEVSPVAAEYPIWNLKKMNTEENLKKQFSGLRLGIYPPRPGASGRLDTYITIKGVRGWECSDPGPGLVTPLPWATGRCADGEKSKNELQASYRPKNLTI